MRIYLLALLFLGLPACHFSPPSAISAPAETATNTRHLAPAGTLGVLNTLGTQAITQLKHWYDDTTAQCGGPREPAYLCSGVAIRATESSPEFYPWDPGQSAILKGSVSFSWLRRDNNFAAMYGRRNGFILYPEMATPNGKEPVSLLCSFPTNANTAQRPTREGCGPMTRYESETDICQRLGINDAAGWLARYPSPGNFRVCGWDMREPGGNPATLFMSSLRAHQGLPEQAAWRTNNEVLMSVWPVGSGAQLPLYAFFYMHDDQEALAKAQFDQFRFYRTYGQLRPIVALALPASKTAPAQFSYAEDDQAVGQPPRAHTVRFDDIPVGHYEQFSADGVGFRLSYGERGISDQPVTSPLFEGHYVKADSAIEFVVPGAGPRQVTFAWACNANCVVQEHFSQLDEELVPYEHEGSMVYGQFTVTLDGPGIFRLAEGRGEGGEVVLLDNLRVEPLPTTP